MSYSIKYEFQATPWRYPGPSSWHFVSLPKEISTEIRTHLKWQEEGWGRMKAKAAIGNSQWETAIWYDNKQATYLLPLKSFVRKKEGIDIHQTIHVTIWI